MEPWLSGPVAGVDPMLQPAAHALIHSVQEIRNAVLGADPPIGDDAVWMRPGGVAASIGFHLRHLAGSTDRLLTYARGEQLTDEQREFLKGEGVREAGPQSAAELAANAELALERAIEVIRGTPASRLLEKRVVGRKELPTNLHGLLFHVAEHAQRHTGQLITTIRVIQGEGS